MKGLLTLVLLFSLNSHARKPATVLSEDKPFLRCTKILEQDLKHAWYELKNATINITHTPQGNFHFKLESSDATNHHLRETVPDNSFFRQDKFQIQQFDKNERMKLLNKSYSIIWGRSKNRLLIQKINDSQAELEFLQKAGGSVYISLKMACELN